MANLGYSGRAVVGTFLAFTAYHYIDCCVHVCFVLPPLLWMRQFVVYRSFTSDRSGSLDAIAALHDIFGFLLDARRLVLTLRSYRLQADANFGSISPRSRVDVIDL